jgi:hypothetical protein
MSRSSFCGRSRPGFVFRAAAGVGTLALAAACSTGHPSAAASHAKSPMPEMSSSMPMASPSMSMGGGMLPTGTRHMHVAIVSPAAGTKVTGNSVTVHVAVTGYRDTCAGRQARDGDGGHQDRALPRAAGRVADQYVLHAVGGGLAAEHQARHAPSLWCPPWMTTHR